MDNTKLMDIIAYYLSEYDMTAVSKLGYASRIEALRDIGHKMGKDNDYLKRLRDEFDVVTSSSRKGQRNRPPRKRIINTKCHLETFSFEELSQIVMSIIDNPYEEPSVDVECDDVLEYNMQEISEEEIEHIINFKDDGAGIKIINGPAQKRIYKTSIIKQLKRLYKGQCQICGCNPSKEYNVNIVEVHHIDYFCSSQNNNSSNLLVLCPNHHRIIHKLNPTFNVDSRSFLFENGEKLGLVLDYHLLAE